MHVEVIDFDTSVNHGRFLTYDVTGLVTILDNGGLPVANADVDVQWSGAFSGTETIQTDANGVASTSTITIDNNETVCLAVTDVQHPSFTYDSNQNIENQDCITV